NTHETRIVRGHRVRYAFRSSSTRRGSGLTHPSIARVDEDDAGELVKRKPQREDDRTAPGSRFVAVEPPRCPAKRGRKSKPKACRVADDRGLKREPERKPRARRVDALELRPIHAEIETERIEHEVTESRSELHVA